jgi:glycosyltransferase involved in cell wall biosynthesis
MFSVLVSVYHRESPAALAAALQSLQDQTVAPAEIVLVKDGPLTPALEAVIERHAASLRLKIVALPANVGLARALDAGIEAATQPWVMRFDSDDVCRPDRVALQSARIARGDVDLLGGQIDEFDADPGQPARGRRVPCTHAEIVRFGVRRNPFNHMTVCFRRADVVAAGGYPRIHLMEDYGLWMTLIARGARAANCPEVLVHARVGNGMVARRGGLAYVRSEWALQRHMRRLGLKSRAAALRDGLVRSAVFLAPVGLRAAIYARLLRRRAG